MRKPKKPKVAMRAFTDGGCRGNPGPAAWAFLVEKDDGTLYAESEYMGVATNNRAEWTALEKLLEWASENKVQHLEVFSDSKNLVEQIQGHWKVKNEELKKIHERCVSLMRGIELKISHVPREQNTRADKLVNIALDAWEQGEKQVSRCVK